MVGRIVGTTHGLKPLSPQMFFLHLLHSYTMNQNHIVVLYPLTRPTYDCILSRPLAPPMRILVSDLYSYYAISSEG
jgi:hypothetical protein